MNSWLKSLGVGVIATIAVWLIGTQLNSGTQKKQYKVRYILGLKPWDSPITGVSDEMIARTVTILQRRLDISGHSSTYTLTREDNHQPLIDLSITGVTDTLFITQIISGNNLLQFWETYRIKELPDLHRAVNKSLYDLYPDTTNKKVDIVKKQSVLKDSSLTALMEQTDNKTAVKAPEEKDISSLIISQGDPNIIGMVHLKDTPTVGNILRSPVMAQSLPSDAQYCFGRPDNTKRGNEFVPLYILRTRGRQRAFLQNEDIETATADFDDSSGNPMISFSFTKSGTIAWENMTRQNVQRSIAICLDGNIVLAPVVTDPITGGQVQLTGAFTVEESRTIATFLKADRLPATIIIRKATVSALSPGISWGKWLLLLFTFIISSTIAFFIFKTLKSS